MAANFALITVLGAGCEGALSNSEVAPHRLPLVQVQAH